MKPIIKSIYKDFEAICRGQISYENEDFEDIMIEKYNIGHWLFELRLVGDKMLNITGLIKEKVKHYAFSHDRIKSIEEFEKTLILVSK
jgi:hypothetical protein